jgi:hypothetical protein
MIGRLNYGVLFRVKTATKLVFFSRWDFKTIPDTSNLAAMSKAPWGSVVTRREDILILHDDGPNLPSETGGTLGDQVNDAHKIFIPSGT